MRRAYFFLFLFLLLGPGLASAEIQKRNPTGDLSVVGAVPYASGPTFTIASSTSLNYVGAKAICTGKDDQIKINAAIQEIADYANTLGEGGGRIELKAGYFHLSGPIIVPGMTNGTLTITGQAAMATVIYLDSGSNTDCV